MKKEDVTNRKELMIFLLLELHKKNSLVDFGNFFMESGYAQGIDSFRKLLDDMHEKGWLTKYNEPTGKHVPGMPYLRTMDLRYGIDIDGIEYLESLGLIEDKFKVKKEINPNINNTISISDSTIGQVNQSSEKIDLKSPIKQKTVHKTDNAPSKKSLIEIASWIIGIIAGFVAIYEFIIKRFID